ncbi:hypothetical protein [Methylomonas sp. AM2-LC]|uniref:hypothetical protein n=1 Tax=Methylomonas sp. AM2-LC TaxID=3153301 RepID=UPI003265A1EF
MTLFSQATGVLKEALSDAGESGGLCRSMSIRWIKGRANGKNFLSELILPGQQVNTSIVKAMADEYKSLGEQDIGTQVSYIKAQLVGAGLECTGAHLETLPSANVFSVGPWFTLSSDKVGMGKLRSINIFGKYPHAMAMDFREAVCNFL